LLGIPDVYTVDHIIPLGYPDEEEEKSDKALCPVRERASFRRELAEKVKAASGQTELTFALFNNHWQGYAPRNATDMMKALKLPFTELPVQIKFPDDETENPKKGK